MKRALAVVLFRLFTIGVCVDGYEVSVTERDTVTLKSGFTEIQTDDEIEWRFSGRRIAKISRGDRGISVKVELDGSFRDRLQLDNQTGDLKISNIRTADSGEYKPIINSPRGSPPEVTFTVKVVSAAEVKSVPLLEGDSVTLLIVLTEKQRDDVIQWRFGQQKSPVAEINIDAGISRKYDDVLDGRFRDRLELDQTGSLTITNTRTTDSGLYEADIIRTSSKHTIHKTFSLTVSDDVKPVSVLEGDNVTLQTRLPRTEIIKQIRWTFGDDGKVIADLNGPVKQKWSNFGLNLETRDLTIRNIQSDQRGLYKVEIITRRMILHRKYQITMVDGVKSVSVKKGETVTLPITEIQNNDLIQWMFEDTVLAEINKTAKRFFTYNGPDGRFRNRLELDYQAGSLIINNTRTTDSGLYEVKIISSRHIVNSIFTVTVTAVPGPRLFSDDLEPHLSSAVPGPHLSSAVPDQRLSSGAVGVIGGGVGLLLGAAVGAAAGVICYRYKRSKNSKDNQMQNQPLKGQLADDTENVSLKNLCGSQSAESDTENSPFREIKGNKEHGYDIL